MSKIRWLVCCLVVCSGWWLYGCQDHKNEVEARRLLDQCKKIKVGVQYQEVYKLMGDPINITEFEKNGREKVRYYYLSPRLASTFTQCVVDKQSGLVEEVLCGE